MLSTPRLLSGFFLCSGPVVAALLGALGCSESSDTGDKTDAPNLNPPAAVATIDPAGTGGASAPPTAGAGGTLNVDLPEPVANGGEAAGGEPGIGGSAGVSFPLVEPNVLFIIADDLTTTAVSAYSADGAQTPNIDQLAAEGLRYTRAYTQFPQCGPSRASFLSGYYPHATGTFGQVSGRKGIGPDRKMWPELFKANGYYTARVSKIFHMGVPRDIENGSDGTDDPASWSERFNSQGPEWQAPGQGELVQGNPDGSLPIKGGNVMTIVAADGDDDVHSDGKTARKAIELINAHKDAPFFLAVGLVRPHVPFVAPKSYFTPYPADAVIVPEQVANDWDDIPKPGINYVTSVNGQMSLQQEQKAIAAYYASVAFMDAQVGKILGALRDAGLEDNTIVIFTSDHGYHLGEHRFWMKISLHEESVRVPLIIKVPGIAPGVRDAFVELLDLYPTTAKLAGLTYSEHLQGKSLVETFTDPEHSVRESAFSTSLGGNAFLLRDEQWAYIQYGEDAAGGIELYSMAQDPKQYTNLAEDPAHADTVASYRAKVQQKLMAIRDNDLGAAVRWGLFYGMLLVLASLIVLAAIIGRNIN